MKFLGREERSVTNKDGVPEGGPSIYIYIYTYTTTLRVIRRLGEFEEPRSGGENERGGKERNKGQDGKEGKGRK